ncbi:MAG: GDP-L-fucose synthase [Desulfobacterales bacterium]|nr:GDP-L-fucose synthase [Desulfobacterales bacterium]
MPDSKILSSKSRIFVAGHRGMVGSAIIRYFKAEGYTNIITQSRDRLDLTDQQAVRDFFMNEKIDYVVLTAARVGGIHTNNTYPAEFIYQNIMIQANAIHEAYRAGVERLLFLGSSCIYPRNCPQPMKEEYLLTGHLEPTNEPYAAAKIAGIKLCESYNRQYGTKYRSVMPTNLYGPNDNYDLSTSHVLPALIRKFHLAKLASQKDIENIKKDELCYGSIPKDICDALGLDSHILNQILNLKEYPPKVVLWGTGKPCREFLHVDDLASACVFLMCIDDSVYDSYTEPMMSHINIGTGKDITISKLAETIKDVVGFEGEIIKDSNKPDGTPRKLLDVSKINKMGWKASISLREGLTQTYNLYKTHET